MNSAAMLATFALLLCLSSCTSGVRVMYGHTSEEWQGRRTYQIVTDRFSPSTLPADDCRNLTDYCGGTFKGIMNHLDYITGMGFNAIWISPVITNAPTHYHGYCGTDFFNINPNFGTQQDLRDLVAACHKAGVWVMVDLIVNQAAAIGSNFHLVQPFNKSEYYHPRCEVKTFSCFKPDTLRCWLLDLADFDQDHPFVREQLEKYVKWVLSFGFDGIRADTVKYVTQDYWVNLTRAIGPIYIAGEVWDSFDCQYQYTHRGIPATLNYQLYEALRGVYLWGKSMYTLGDVWREQLKFDHPKWEMNFVDNHDNVLFMTYTGSASRYRSALAHLYFTIGVPCVYYGTEHLFTGTVEDRTNRQALWKTGFAKTPMYHFLHTLGTVYDKMNVTHFDVQERWQDDSIYCLIRGPLLLCTTNTDNEQTREIPNLPFSGLKVCDAFHPDVCVRGSSTMRISVPAGGEPLLLLGFPM